MIHHTHPTPSRRAFTLIELIIVISIIGILAALVMPKFSNGKEEAALSAIATNVHGVQTKASAEWARSGDWPATVDSAWFIGGTPDHPQNSFGVPAIEVVNTPGLRHPANKVLKAGVGGAYWYNTAEGVFRARLADAGSAAATLEDYNRINGASETALGNY